MKKRSFLGGAAILVAAGLITRLLGFVYRIYLSNIIGAEGMGLIGLVGPVYSLIVLTLTSGVSIAVSRLTAEERAKGNECNTGRITRVAIMVVGLGGVIASLVMLLAGHLISDVILKDPRTYLSLLALVPCVPIVACEGAIKGYFYGVQKVAPPAVANVLEQVVRIGLVILVLPQILNAADSVIAGSSWGVLASACALVTVAGAIGEIVNLTVLYVIYVIDRKKSERCGTLLRRREIGGKILRISVPISVNRLLTSVIGAVEAILIPRRLLVSGLDYQESLSQLGRLSGMASPLIYFPTVITSAIATTLVPAISEAVSLKNYHLANSRISRSIQISTVLGFVFMIVFMCFPNEIGNFLYEKEHIGAILYQLSFTCVFVYLQQTFTGILNGFDKQKEALRSSVIGDLVRIGFVWFAVPVYGVKGYVYGMIVSCIIVCVMNFTVIMKTTGMSVDFRNWIIKPGLVSLGMYFLSGFIKKAVDIFPLSGKLETLILVFVTVAFSLMAMSAVGVFRLKDILKTNGKTYKIAEK